MYTVYTNQSSVYAWLWNGMMCGMDVFLILNQFVGFHIFRKNLNHQWSFCFCLHKLTAVSRPESTCSYSPPTPPPLPSLSEEDTLPLLPTINSRLSILTEQPIRRYHSEQSISSMAALVRTEFGSHSSSENPGNQSQDVKLRLS